MSSRIDLETSDVEPKEASRPYNFATNPSVLATTKKPTLRIKMWLITILLNSPDSADLVLFLFQFQS